MLQITFQAAARSHAALARLRTLRTLELWPYSWEGPPSGANTKALLAALVTLPGVRVLWRDGPRHAATHFLLPPSDLQQLAELCRILADAMMG